MAQPARKPGSDVHAPARVWLAPEVKDRDRRPEYAWLREHAHEYSGEWVALDGDRLLAHGVDFAAIVALIPLEGRENVLFHRVVLD
jgi:hypothetical protein